ncbi:MAG: glycosyltransferase family 2 protein [Bacteroidales bacterium]|nr:glycosyltransferase family 2 protein [Bacteroidales bacterium]
MVNNRKIAIVLPAYNAEKTLRRTFEEIPAGIADFIILTDDHSSDGTLSVARSLPLSHIIEHDRNKGYGANQKTCYDKALALGADIIVMLHPDYQYTPRLIPAMCNLISAGLFDVVLGSRILGRGALEGGMPLYKYIANRFLTFFQNIMLNQKLSEYHTGFRAYSAEVLRNIAYKSNSDTYIFDNQVLAQIIERRYRIGEISCPTEYSDDSSSINFRNSLAYGTGVIWVSLQFFLHRATPLKSGLFGKPVQQDAKGDDNSV